MLQKHVERRELSKDHELPRGSKNDQKHKESNDKKQSQRWEFVTINRREKKTYLSYFRGSHEKYMPLHYLWGLLFCNLKIEQTKHLATISSASLLVCYVFTIPPL